MKDVVKEAQTMVQELQEAFNDGGLDSLVEKTGEVMAQIVAEVVQAAPKLIETAENLVWSFIQGIVDHQEITKHNRRIDSMELLNYLSQVPIPVLILVIAVLVVVTAVVTYQYAKAKGLEGIRKEVYELFLHAEHIYKESGQGEQKLKWVVQQARGLLPQWLRIFITEDMLVKVINEWFKGVKDLLDDGKVNGSQKGE